MVNETIKSNYEIVNLRTILIFVGKNYFSETKGGVLKMSTWFQRGGQPNVYVRLQGERGGVKNALNSVYVVCTQSLMKIRQQLIMRYLISILIGNPPISWLEVREAQKPLILGAGHTQFRMGYEKSIEQNYRLHINKLSTSRHISLLRKS